jgi:hypothetical protein
MQMDTSERSHILREADPIAGRSRDPIIDAVLRELRFNEQTPPRIPVGPSVSDGGTFEAFIDGSGI